MMSMIRRSAASVRVVLAVLAVLRVVLLVVLLVLLWGVVELGLGFCMATV
jgi:hypothetical protein